MHSSVALDRELEQLDDGGGPPDDWQDRVLAEVDRPAPPASHALWPIALAGSGLAMAAVVALLVIGLRGPEARRSTGPAAGDPPPARAEMKATTQLEKAVEHVLQARTQAELAEAERRLREAERRLETVKESLGKVRARFPKRDDVKCDPADPLCGLE